MLELVFVKDGGEQDKMDIGYAKSLGSRSFQFTCSFTIEYKSLS